MGIPSFFRWMSEKYPTIINDASTLETDVLHIDFNALIHNATHPEDGPMPRTDEKKYEKVCENLERLVEVAKPKHMLVISTDGVAPRAKINQQRSRRYSAAHNMERTDVEEEKWDHNQISPGTEFMQKLKDYVHNFLICKISTDPKFERLKIIYSDDLRPGEGEHKITAYIKKMNRKLKHVIYSPDADFIFLALILHGFKTYILKENGDYMYEQKKFKCATCYKTGHKTEDCGRLRYKKCIAIDIVKYKNELKSEFDRTLRIRYNLDALIDDFVFICFMAGNDFLPPLQCFDVRFKAIEKLVEILLMNFNGNYITNRGKINFSELHKFFCCIHKEENQLYREKKTQLDLSRTNIYRSKKIHFEEIDLDRKEGKAKFYGKKMGIYTEQAINKLCYNYIKGLYWTYEYYFHGVRNWDYYYIDHYAPFVRDLARVSSFNINLKKTAPLTAIEQLLLIMPPLSKNTIPQSMVDIYNNEESFPKIVKHDMFDKLFQWQAVVKVPMVDVKVINKFYGENKKYLSKEDLSRNIRSSDRYYLGTKNSRFNELRKLFLDKNSMSRIINGPIELDIYKKEKYHNLKKNLKFKNEIFQNMCCFAYINDK